MSETHLPHVSEQSFLPLRTAAVALLYPRANFQVKYNKVIP